MKEKIAKLYSDLGEIGVLYQVYNIRNNVEQIAKVVPEIQEFVLWFLEGNQFGIEEMLYRDMCNNLLLILGDIVEAMEQKDMVLLHDAAYYGLMEYLQLFVATE
ncbi:MAG: hypothetical protein HFH38_03555 [Lachnospiraceae bacterium]|jgi:hypothetical protein|nr:hypothetical protein [Lachnospiraceae bacterium]